jgi:hypothetical protein
MLDHTQRWPASKQPTLTMACETILKLLLPICHLQPGAEEES